MNNETEIEAKDNIERTVNTLLAAKARGEHVYCEFNGHILHSDNVTMDGAYEEITGQTKEEFEKYVEEETLNTIKADQQELQEARLTVPLWIERGNAIIFPERQEAWKKIVNDRVEEIYHGIDIVHALEIMEALEGGASIEEAKEILNNQDNTIITETMVRRIVYGFSSQGPEFFEATVTTQLTPEDKEKLEAKKEENRELLNIHPKESSGMHI